MTHTGKMEDGTTFICTDGKYYMITPLGVCLGACPTCTDFSIYKTEAKEQQSQQEGEQPCQK